LYTPSSSVAADSRGQKTLSSSFGVSEVRSVESLAAAEDAKRVARQSKLFENMVVFDGGCLGDHEALGKQMIMREFIHYGMYHRKWGYYPKLFRKYRQLMTSNGFDPIPFASLRNQHDYDLYIGKLHESTPSYVTPNTDLPALLQLGDGGVSYQRNAS
jgi:hypothetical protein